MKAVLREIKRQKDANREGLRYYEQFASHRKHQTDFILRTAEEAGGSLCVLGAGNCFDLDLARVTESFAEVHLVDIDPHAIKKAKERLEDSASENVTLHAPLDASGANDRLEAWRDMRVSPEALIAFPRSATEAVTRKLPGPFDCVVSSCLLSQILLTYRRVLGEGHQLFQAGLVTLLVTHLRILAALTKPGGKALLITDVTTNEIAPLETFDAASPVSFLERLIESNQIFNYLDPRLLRSLAEEDPALAETIDWRPPTDIWLWQNTQQRAFLVYGAVLLKRPID